jgi:outer membrane biosynthesis protein TonB
MAPSKFSQPELDAAPKKGLPWMAIGLGVGLLVVGGAVAVALTRLPEPPKPGTSSSGVEVAKETPPAPTPEPTPPVVPAPEKAPEPKLAAPEPTPTPTETAKAPPPPAPQQAPPPAMGNDEFDQLISQAKQSIQRDKYKSAMVAYRKALALKPDSIEAKTGLGISLVMSDTSYKEAVKLLEEGVQGDEKNAKAWLSLGMAYQNTGRNNAAWVAYKKYLLLEPQGSSAREIRAMLRAAGQ